MHDSTGLCCIVPIVGASKLWRYSALYVYPIAIHMLIVVNVARCPVPAGGHQLWLDLSLRSIFKQIIAVHQVHLRMLSSQKSSSSEAELLYLRCR